MAEVSLHELTEHIARAIPAVDGETEGQYGAGLGSENEERQLDLIFDYLGGLDERFTAIEREVRYPDGDGRCDLVLPDGMPVEAKLIRYWRANGDPEPTMYGHVFSPFHRNTLLHDGQRLREWPTEVPRGLLGLFYRRADEDPETLEAHHERYTATDIAEKVVNDLEYWYGADWRVCNLADFSGLQHPVHEQGAVISWVLE